MIKNIGVFKDFSDDSIKSVFDAGNNQIIEMTLLANKAETDVVCVPTHHFCNMGCVMCHLTNKGLNKSMVSIKSDDFITCLMQTLTKQGQKRTSKKKLLISFMGVGEPLLNLNLIEEVYKKENLLREKYGYESIGYALATMMPNKNILKLNELVNKLNIPLKIHFSMHTPIDSERFNLIPSTKVTVEEALEYLTNYRKTLQSNNIAMNEYVKLHRSDDPTEIHYTLIKGVNDSEEDLNKLCELLSKYHIPIKFIKFNPTSDLERSENEQIWIDRISKEIPNLRIKTYAPPGKQIGSSCGEFTKHYYHQEIETEEERKEFEKWKMEHQIFEQQRENNISLDEFYMTIAELSAMRSKDPTIQEGACIVSENNKVLSIGYNTPPNGYSAERFNWSDKNQVVHATSNAILNYQGNQSDFQNAKIYVDVFPDYECAKEIIQSGIKEVIYLANNNVETPKIIASKKLFDILGINYRELEIKNKEELKNKFGGKIMLTEEERRELLEELKRELFLAKKVYVERCRPDTVLPAYANEGDAGMDIRAAEETVLMPGETKIIPTGLKLAIPEGYEIQIRPRSGLSAKTNLRIANSPATIDSGYRDELGVIVTNISDNTDDETKYTIDETYKNGIYVIRQGDRIAQIVLNKYEKIEFEELEQGMIRTLGRNRSGGFGSSGVK